MDAQGRVTEFNTVAERMFGYTHEAALGQLVADLIIPDAYRDKHTQGLARYLETGVSVMLGRHLTLIGRRADGTEFPIELSVTRLTVEDNSPPEFIASIRDLTDLRHEEEAHARTLVDVDRARAAAAGQTAELAAMFEAMADAVLVYDVNTYIIHSNTAAHKMFGYGDDSDFERLAVADRIARLSVSDLSGRSLSVDELPQMRAMRGESLTGADAVDMRIRTLRGTEIDVSCSAAPLRNADGALIGAVAIYRDVTERRRLEQELSARARDIEAVNARLRAVLDVLPIGVFIADAKGAFTEVNAMGHEIWGENAPMLESLDEYGTYVGWWPETGEIIKPEEWALARALTTGEHIVGEEIRIRAFDGKTRTVLDSTAPIYDAGGAIVGAVVALMDITERDRLHERTRQALDGFLSVTQSLVSAPGDETSEDASANVSITQRLAELTRNVLGCSRVAITALEGEELVLRQVAVVGLTPEQEREWREDRMRHPEQRADASMSAEMIARLYAGETLVIDRTKPPYNTQPNPYGTTTALVAPMLMHGRMVGLLVVEYLERGPDGRNMPHHFTREETQLTDAIARLGAVVLERERLLREREAARAHTLALEEANRRMDEFIGIAGHELRTPLTSVKANIQLAERRARSLLGTFGDDSATSQPLARLVHLLTNATTGVERQERLVRDLLDISRISSGKLNYRMAPCDLNALTRETIQELLLTAPDRVITLDLPAGPVMALADADRVRQVLTNYVNNALRYTPADRPIAVTVSGDETLARIEVTDQGPGLTPEQQRGLFERFHRVEGIEPMSGLGAGLGLGLYISRMIVERHGGAVGVRSTPEQGATFWFTVPLLIP